MIKRFLKRIIIILISIIVLSTNCYALSNEEIFIKDDVEYIKRTYSVSREQERNFLINLGKEFKIDKKTYQLDNLTKTGGDILETIDISTTRTIKSDTNELNKILEQLPKEIKYNEDGFVGVYKLDVNSINVETQYNGYKEKLIEETKIYTNLETNDLNNIPKQIKKEGLTLDLIATNWEVAETRKIQENSIPSKYNATCYYATKIRVDNPLTYNVTAQYNGTADKVIENDYIYEVIYKHIATDKNYIPAIILFGGTLLIILVIIVVRRKNVVIYNFFDNEWIEIGRQRISKPIIKLDKYDYKIKSNRYKIMINEKFVDKYNGKMLKIIRRNKTIGQLINKANNITPYTIDIVI